MPVSDDDYELTERDREILAMPWRESFLTDFEWLEEFLQAHASQITKGEAARKRGALARRERQPAEE